MNALTNTREPLLQDLEFLAHELENDCNYPFAGLRDARGEAYTAKLARLREQLADIDAMLDESRELVIRCKKQEADQRLLGGALLLLKEAGVKVGSSELRDASNRAHAEQNSTP